MSKKFNVKDIFNEMKNELDHSPLFQPQPTSASKNISSIINQMKDVEKTNQQNTSIPERQKAGNLENQYNTTAMEK